MLFKSRDLLIGQRTQLLNALRGHFGEVGIVAPKGPHEVRSLVAHVMHEEKAQALPDAMGSALRPLVAALFALNDEIATLDKAILKLHRCNALSQKLATVPGIGTLIATVLTATVNDAASFNGGREFAAWLGLVPRQHSTGGKARLGKISKMGNRDLRRLLVVGAHAALYRIKSGKTQSPLADWARKLLAGSRSSLWPWRLPTRWPASPGRSWQRAKVTIPRARQSRHKQKPRPLRNWQGDHAMM